MIFELIVLFVADTDADKIYFGINSRSGCRHSCSLQFFGRHLVGLWIGGVWNGHFPETEKYFSEAEFCTQGRPNNYWSILVGPPSCTPKLGDQFLSSAGTEGNCALPMRLPDPSPVPDKNRAPMGPKILSSTGAGVWRKAPMAFPASRSVLDKSQSATKLHQNNNNAKVAHTELPVHTLPPPKESILLHPPCGISGQTQGNWHCGVSHWLGAPKTTPEQTRQCQGNTWSFWEVQPPCQPHALDPFRCFSSGDFASHDSATCANFLGYFLLCLLPRRILWIFFSCLPGNFALKNGGDFWWIFSGLRLPRNEAREILEKFWENSEQNSGENSGRKFEKFGKLSFCNIPDLNISYYI